MEQFEQLTELSRIRTIRETTATGTLPILERRREGLAEITHDVCNMVTALDLYCDLLQEPGVLAPPYAHYSGELRLVAAASQRLVDKLITLEAAASAQRKPIAKAEGSEFLRVQEPLPQWKNARAKPITDLAEELLANRNLLAALAGPSIAVTVDVEGGALPVRMTGEDLTRILVNLVKNAAKAMGSAGRIQVTLWESPADAGDVRWLTLTIEDNGPGLPDCLLNCIFEPRSSEARQSTADAEQPFRRHGLGLSITRSIVEAAGGVIHAANRNPAGASFQIQLPATAANPFLPTEHYE